MSNNTVGGIFCGITTVAVLAGFRIFIWGIDTGRQCEHEGQVPGKRLLDGKHLQVLMIETNWIQFSGKDLESFKRTWSRLQPEDKITMPGYINDP